MPGWVASLKKKLKSKIPEKALTLKGGIQIQIWMNHFSIFSKVRPPKITSDWSNYVRSLMFDYWKLKIGFSSSNTNRWTRSSLFDVRKIMMLEPVINFVNLVKVLLVSMFDRSKPKNDVRVHSMFVEMEFDPSLWNTEKFFKTYNQSWLKMGCWHQA